MQTCIEIDISMTQLPPFDETPSEAVERMNKDGWKLTYFQIYDYKGIAYLVFEKP